MQRVDRGCASPAVAVALVALANCTSVPRDDRVTTKYDSETGKLVEISVDTRKDGKPNIVSYVTGKKIVGVEIDRDEDGKIDRWEQYGDDQRILRVGFSGANNGKPDAWAFRSPDGALARMEISTKSDGRFNRTQFYERGALIKAEEDTDADGEVDKWETYRDGALATAAFDTNGSGRPTVSIDYGRRN
jgi:hypothetical protein